MASILHSTVPIMNRSFIIEWPSKGREKDAEFVRKVADICHENKHLFQSGYRFSRQIRENRAKETGQIFSYWSDCPGVSHCYNLNITGNRIKISICPSTVGTSPRYTPRELNHITQNFEMGIIDEIIAMNPDVKVVSTSDDPN